MKWDDWLLIGMTIFGAVCGFIIGYAVCFRWG